jgi:hypothetical protein
MASCRSRPSLGDAWTLTAPPEAIVGDPFSLVVCPPRGGAGPRDWVGLYPASVPTVAGVSQGRWLYISAACSGGSSSRPGSPLPPPPRGPVRLDWPAHMLPNHAGLFEFRVHGAGGYGPALAVARVAVLPGRSHTVRRGVAFAVLICAVWAFQSLLNAKGVCVWAPPETTPDPIIDHGRAAAHHVAHAAREPALQRQGRAERDVARRARGCDGGRRATTRGSALRALPLG